MITGTFGLITLTALGGALYNVFAATMASLDALAREGWAAYVDADPSNTLTYLYKCVMHSECGPVLGQQWVAHYSLLPLFIIPPALVATIIATRVANRPIEQKAPGQAHWGTTEELKREGYLKSKTGDSGRGYFGIHKDSRKMIQLPEHIRYSHCLVIGGPGARKSTGYHKQNIIQDMRDGVNIIAFDLKYPDPRGGFFDMVTLATDHYGYDAQLMLPYDKVTHRYSLLTKATTETGARNIASMILPPGQGKDSSEFYRNNERIILTALILAAARKDNGSLKEIVDALRQGARGMSAFVKAAADPDVANMITTVLDGIDMEKAKGILNGLLGKLEIFGDPDLLAFGQLSKDPRENIDLRRFSNAKTILYIGVPQQKLGSNGQMFLQLIKRSIDSELSEISRENAGVFPIPISYYLDEFANFGPLPDIGADFATMRSRRLSYHVTVQNMAQGAAVYGHQEWESFYRSNFQSVLIFPRYIRFGDADLFSKFAGNLTTLEQSTSDSKGGFESRTSVNTREVSRPLMSTEEMKEWPQAEGVAFLNGIAPVRVVLPRLDEPQINGYKNPYHPDYTRIPKNLNPYQWVAERFNRLAMDRRRTILDTQLQIVQTRIKENQSREEHNHRTRQLRDAAKAAANDNPDTNSKTPAAPQTALQPRQPQITPTTPQPPQHRPASQVTQTRPAENTPASNPTAQLAAAPPPEAPKGAKRFNLLIGTLIKARVDPTTLKVSKGKRLLELAFATTPDLTARLEPYRELLVTQSKLLAYREKEVALTRAGLLYLADNYTAYYYRLGVKPYSRQQRAALADPQGPNLQLPVSHNAARNALRKEITRLTKRNSLTWRPDGNQQPVLNAPIGGVDANRLHTYGAYWKQLGLAIERDGLLVIHPKALIGLPQPALDALPLQPQTPRHKQAQTPTPTQDDPHTPDAPSEPQAREKKRRGNDPQAAAKRLKEAPNFPNTNPPPQNDKQKQTHAEEEKCDEAQAASYAEPSQELPDNPGTAAQPREAHNQSASLKPMPDDVRKPAAVIVRPGEKSDADTIALVTDTLERHVVQEWIDKNKTRLNGHPEATQGLAKSEMIGAYAGERYLIPTKTAKQILAEAGITDLSADLKRETHRIRGGQDEWVILDPASSTSSDHVVLIGNAVDGRHADSVLHLVSLLHIPLNEAWACAPEFEWARVQATMHGPRAWVKVYVTAPKAATTTVAGELVVA